MSDDKKPLTSEEVKAKVIEEFGLDPETDGEKIDKIVAREIAKQSEHQKELSRAIQRKSEYRQQLIDAGLIDPKTFKPIKKKPDGNDHYATKDDLKEFGQRQRYPHLNDEEYASINALAKASGKSFEETLEKNPVATAYMQTVDVNKRLAGATKAPGTRIASGEQKTEEDKIGEELSSDLPRSRFSPKS